MKRILVALTIAIFAASPATFAQGNSGNSAHNNSGQASSAQTTNSVKSGIATGLNHLGLSQTEALGILGGVAAAGLAAGVAVAASSGGGGSGTSGTSGG